MNPQAHTLHGTQEEDTDIVAIWLRKDVKRWIAGAMAGIFAGLVMAAFAGILAVISGYEFTFPIKVAAAPFLGGSATDFQNTTALIVGFLMHEFLCAVLGMVYGHFTGAGSNLPTLLGAGFTWGIFSWIFISCLFSQSFTGVAALAIPKAAFLPVNLVFGLALTSIAFFDPLIRGGDHR